MKRAIVTFANDRGNYRKAADRLSDSLKKFSDVPLQIYTNESWIGAPLHQDNPYAFKIFCIENTLKNSGTQQVLWLDSSVYAVKDIQPIWDLIDRDGYVMQEAGHVVGNWCNDNTLMYYNLTREDALKIPMYGNAGLLGLDFSKSVSRHFFHWWKIAMECGLFKGSWDDHRHDMTCGSIIANRLCMKYQPGDTILQYAAPEDPVLNDSIIFKAQGL